MPIHPLGVGDIKNGVAFRMEMDSLKTTGEESAVPLARRNGLALAKALVLYSAGLNFFTNQVPIAGLSSAGRKFLIILFTAHIIGMTFNADGIIRMGFYRIHNLIKNSKGTCRQSGTAGFKLDRLGS